MARLGRLMIRQSIKSWLRFASKNGGKPPNIVYILLDDVGFGEIGMDELSVTRGYKTPNLSSFAKEGLSLQRAYSEPSCTPTRVAMMTGRYPIAYRIDRGQDDTFRRGIIRRRSHAWLKCSGMPGITPLM